MEIIDLQFSITRLLNNGIGTELEKDDGQGYKY